MSWSCFSHHWDLIDGMYSQFCLRKVTFIVFRTGWLRSSDIINPKPWPSRQVPIILTVETLIEPKNKRTVEYQLFTDGVKVCIVYKFRSSPRSSRRTLTGKVPLSKWIQSNRLTFIGSGRRSRLFTHLQSNRTETPLFEHLFFPISYWRSNRFLGDGITSGVVKK